MITNLDTLPVGTWVRLVDHEHYTSSTKHGEMFTVIQAPLSESREHVVRSHRSGLAVAYPKTAQWEVIPVSTIVVDR